MKKNRRLLSILLALVLLLSVQTMPAFAASEIPAPNTLGVDVGEYGFTLLEEIPLADDYGYAYQLEHDKTGARLVYFDVDDEEKSFGLGFKVEPENDHGANHVLEHTLLMGSEKYPTRNAFTYILSSSMATFINAYTAADHTLYPIASKNDKDYYNLMSVYLDMVFDPLIMKDENIFKQEGIRYELTDPEADINITGVVFSEMKTYYSDYNWQMANKQSKLLFQDTCLQYESGGTPDDIPNLTYQELVDTYTKFYNPSNCLAFLYGNQDIRKSLEMIAEYFDRFEKTESLGNSQVQPYLLAPIYAEDTYAVASDDIVSRPQIGVAYQVNLPDDIETTTGLSMVADMMFAVTSAPVFRPLLDTGWMTSVGGYLDTSASPCTFHINMIDVDPEHIQDALAALDEIMAKVVRDGFDKDYIDAMISYYAYRDAMEANQTTVGVSLNGVAMQSYRQIGDPLATLKDSTLFERDYLETLAEKADTDYFTDLIQKYIIDNRSKVTVVLYPEQGKEQRVSEALADKLRLYKATLGQEGIETLISETAEFTAWQNTPDSPEVIAMLPSLKLEDLTARPREVDVRERQVGPAKVIHTNVETHGISAVSMYFDISHLSLEDMQLANLYSNLIGYLPTEQYNEQQLDIQMLSYLGGFGVSVGPSVNYFDADIYTPQLNISFDTLPTNIGKSLEIIVEMVSHSVIKDIMPVSQVLSMLSYNLKNSMDVYGPLYSAYASMFEAGNLVNYLYGAPYYDFTNELAMKLETDWDEVVQELSHVQGNMLNTNNLVIGFTGSGEDFDAFCAELETFLEGISDEEIAPAEYEFEDIPDHLAFTSVAQTLTVIMAGDTGETPYSGSASIMGSILESKYLWPSIREQGGAYHTSYSYGQNGFSYVYSMYDPNLTRTLEVFRGIPEFLRNVEISGDELESMIVAHLNGFDESFTPVNLWNFGAGTYLTGLTIEDLNKIREEILGVDIEVIRGYADIYEDFIDQDRYYVGGNETVISSEAEIFDEIIPIQ